MATATVRKRVSRALEISGRTSALRESTALRLLSAERSEEIFPILLEEVVALGIPRAFVLGVDFETGEVAPVASLKCSKTYLQKFHTSLWAGENSVIRVLHSLQPGVLSDIGYQGNSVYCHPIVYRNQNFCWEAERERRHDCLAVQNYRAPRKLQLNEQVCNACGMRAYSALVCLELRLHSAVEL